MRYENPEVQPMGDRQPEIQRKLTKPNSTADPEGSNNPNPTANPVKKRPSTDLSGNEREDGELKDRFGRAITFTYNRHIHTHIHSHRHSNGLYKVTESC